MPYRLCTLSIGCDSTSRDAALARWLAIWHARTHLSAWAKCRPSKPFQADIRSPVFHHLLWCPSRTLRPLLSPQLLQLQPITSDLSAAFLQSPFDARLPCARQHIDMGNIDFDAMLANRGIVNDADWLTNALAWDDLVAPASEDAGTTR